MRDYCLHHLLSFLKIDVPSESFIEEFSTMSYNQSSNFIKCVDLASQQRLVLLKVVKKDLRQIRCFAKEDFCFATKALMSRT